MSQKVILITGAAGFIGRAAVKRFRDRYRIIGVDNLSRSTSRSPEDWTSPEDWYDCRAGEFAYRLEELDVSVIIHLAAQVSVTQSLIDPRLDFRSNAYETMQLAHGATLLRRPPVFIYASTNKVYGELKGRVSPVDDEQPLDPQTPYGISKAVGGLYVREFLPSGGYDFRQSCIAGEDQIGDADQGWVGHIRHCIRTDQPITCFGSGEQVRDLLHVDDLLDVYELAVARQIPADSYVVGGGWKNSVKFRAAVDLLGGTISRFADPRPRDQEYFISSNNKLRYRGWSPKIDMIQWLKSQKEVLSRAVL